MAVLLISNRAADVCFRRLATKQQAEAAARQHGLAERPHARRQPNSEGTGDWLARRLEAYSGLDDVSGDGSLISKLNIDGVRIDNNCSFHYTLKLWAYESSSRKNRWTIIDVSLPPGAVSLVQIRGLYDNSVAVSAHFAIDITTGNLEVV